jgi:hypothetical protein
MQLRKRVPKHADAIVPSLPHMSPEEELASLGGLTGELELRMREAAGQEVAGRSLGQQWGSKDALEQYYERVEEELDSEYEGDELPTYINQFGYVGGGNEVDHGEEEEMDEGDEECEHCASDMDDFIDDDPVESNWIILSELESDPEEDDDDDDDDEEEEED